jgi:hypothetical protein
MKIIAEPVFEVCERKWIGPRLKPLGRPCHDCAVVDGFYQGHSDELKLKPIEDQIDASLKWFCHNNVNRACRGNINNLGLANNLSAAK